MSSDAAVVCTHENKSSSRMNEIRYAGLNDKGLLTKASVVLNSHEISVLEGLGGWLAPPTRHSCG